MRKTRERLGRCFRLVRACSEVSEPAEDRQNSLTHCRPRSCGQNLSLLLRKFSKLVSDVTWVRRSQNPACVASDRTQTFVSRFACSLAESRYSRIRIKRQAQPPSTEFAPEITQLCIVLLWLFYVQTFSGQVTTFSFHKRHSLLQLCDFTNSIFIAAPNPRQELYVSCVLRLPSCDSFWPKMDQTERVLRTPAVCSGLPRKRRHFPLTQVELAAWAAQEAEIIEPSHHIQLGI